jgi:hypothetical protein
MTETNAEWIARLWPFPCKTCGTPNANSTEGKDCDACHAKTPEAIAKREADARELAEYHQSLNAACPMPWSRPKPAPRKTP